MISRPNSPASAGANFAAPPLPASLSLHPIRRSREYVRSYLLALVFGTAKCFARRPECPQGKVNRARPMRATYRRRRHSSACGKVSSGIFRGIVAEFFLERRGTIANFPAINARERGIERLMPGERIQQA